MTTSYDVKCFDLAGLFLGDEHGVESWPPEKFARYKHELAQTIQEAIEDWLASKRLREAQSVLNGNPEFSAGSCAHCGKFHSSAVCP